MMLGEILLTRDQIKRLVHEAIRDRENQVLLLLAADGVEPRTVKAIRTIALEVGLSRVAKWNISDVLGRSGFAVRVPKGWELTEGGKERVRALAGLETRVVTEIATELRKQVQSLTHVDTIAFLEEAISSLEIRNYRAAVVLSWVGAVALLQDYIIKNKLTEFNHEAQRRDAKWRSAKTADDLGRMKEYDFLQVLNAISVIGKNVKQELENSLTLRNACGHPNSLKIADNRVAAHLEILLLNIYKPFG